MFEMFLAGADLIVMLHWLSEGRYGPSAIAFVAMVAMVSKGMGWL